MARRVQISVIGYDSKLCTEEAYSSAVAVGKEIAMRGGVLVCGGLGGVMEAACKGASDAGGLSVGIIPSDQSTDANKYCDLVVTTGLGFARNFPVVYSGDAIIIVGGGSGTLMEVAAAYQKGRAMVALRGTGGVADAWSGKYLDERKKVRIIGANTPKEAVVASLRLAQKHS